MRNEQTPDTPDSNVTDTGRRSFLQEGRVDTTDEAWQRGMTPMSVLRYEEDVSDAPTVISGGPDELPDLSDLFPTAGKRPGARATYTPPSAGGDEAESEEGAGSAGETAAAEAVSVAASSAPAASSASALEAVESAPEASAPEPAESEAAESAPEPASESAPAEGAAEASSPEAASSQAAESALAEAAAEASSGSLTRWTVIGAALLVGAGLVSFLLALGLILLMS